MKSWQLKYGDQSVGVSLDADAFTVLEPREAAGAPLSDYEIDTRIDLPIDSPVLEEIVSPNETVLIVVSDATRQTASAQTVNLLVRRLVQAGIAPRDIKIIFATGIHRPVTTDEKHRLLTTFVAERIETIDHDPFDESRLVNLGETDSGIGIEVNRALLDFSHVILTGGINFHYFAGFTGGRKSVCPGLSSWRTIKETHLLALDLGKGERRAGVAAGRLDGNAVHEACERVAAEVAPSFAVNAITDERGLAIEIFAGDWRMSHRQACAEYADANAIPVEEKRRLVIASCGGAPYDINLIQAHKALEFASGACAEGGTIILLAECAEGFGRADFLKWFDAADSRQLTARLRDDYEVNGQTAWALLSKTERFNVVLVSALAAEDVRQMGMTPASSIDEALASLGDGRSVEPGYIIPRAASVLPYKQS